MAKLVYGLSQSRFPPAALITAGGRLLLAMLEKMVTDAGGTYLMCDTDSMAIVASECGGLVACKGGPYRMPEGSEAIKAFNPTLPVLVQTFETVFQQYHRHPTSVDPASLAVPTGNYASACPVSVWPYKTRRFALGDTSGTLRG